MRFIFGANIDDSLTTGMGRQMHGLGDALAVRGHDVDYLFTGSLGLRLGRKLSRLEAPFRFAQEVGRLAARGGAAPIAVLHEPIGWATAVLLRRRVHTLAMVHACELNGWKITVGTRAATGEHIAASSRILWPLTELTQAYATLKAAEGVLCLSSQDAAYIHDRLHVPSDRVRRIDNGLEPRFIGLPLPEAPTERDILFLGSWLPRKGIRILVAALEKLTAAGVTAKLTLAGTAASAELIRGALPPAWRSDAEIIPHVPAAGLIDIYRRHAIFVLPSVAEGIPLAMLEAMAAGLCPVVTEVGGVPDVVQHGKNGLLVPMLNADRLADALTRALRTPEETRRLGREAHATMQAYGWERVAVQVERFCAERLAARA
jgi:glycosyltransferase involved in cell wall biosynthesis